MPALLSTKRQQQILRFIQDNQQATVAELSRLFDVSETTIRRDLDRLESMGNIQRTHGGALANERAAPEPPVLHRIAENAEEKAKIGRAAADLVQDGETIFLGSGTTTLEVARCLDTRDGLTVITNALSIVNVFAEKPSITMIVLGGLFRHSELSVIGHIAEQTLQELRADKIIMGIRAISLHDGLTNDYLPETMTDRAIINLTREVIVVADHTKFGRVSTSLVAPISSVDVIVTDTGAPPDQIKAIRNAGVRVITA